MYGKKCWRGKDQLRIGCGVKRENHALRDPFKAPTQRSIDHDRPATW